jgi:RimJ/RimL family protein N-acetyltransferase
MNGNLSNFTLYNNYILLKPFTKKNITKKYLNCINNKKINQYLIVGKKKQNKKSLLEYYLERIKNNDLFYSIYEKKFKKFIGTITLRISNKNKAFIGNLIFYRKYWGSLESQIAFNIFLDFAFKVVKVNNIYAGTQKFNIGSNFNLIKNNFKVIKKTKSKFYFLLKKKNYKKLYNYKLL